jgi:hypothetical protein
MCLRSSSRSTSPSVSSILRGDEPTEECPSFSFSKDSWHAGHHERVVLVPNADADPQDSDWQVYRWGIGGRWAYSSDPRFAEALAALLRNPWPMDTAVRLADVIEKV